MVSLSVLTEKPLIVYNLLCSTEARRQLEERKALTATFLVCTTDVAQMVCMFYILYLKSSFLLFTNNKKKDV